MDAIAKKCKRDRAKNFTEEEKEMLIELVNSFKHIFENKETDGVTCKQKDRAWASQREILMPHQKEEFVVPNN
jgi:hypothetical protein